MPNNTLSITDVQQENFYGHVLQGSRANSLLRDRYFRQEGFTGTSLQFTRLDRKNMSRGVAPANIIPIAEGDYKPYVANMQVYKYRSLVDENWAVQVAFDQPDAESDAASRAMGEAMDEPVVAALKAYTYPAAQKVTKSDAGALRLAAIQGRKWLRRNSFEIHPTMTTLAINSDLIDNILEDRDMRSRDFSKAYLQETGEVNGYPFLRFQLLEIPAGRAHESRYGAVAATKFYAYDNKCIAGGEQLGKTNIAWDNNFGGWSIYASLNAGAVIRDPEGVFEGTVT